MQVVLPWSIESTSFFPHDATMKDESAVQNRSIICERVKEKDSEEMRVKVRMREARAGRGGGEETYRKKEKEKKREEGKEAGQSRRDNLRAER